MDGDDRIVSGRLKKVHKRATGAWPAITSPTYQTKHSLKEKHSEWVYYTIRLPKYMTEGKDSVDLRFVTLPESSKSPPRSQPLYRAYTHTEPLFDLPADEAAADYDLGRMGDPLDKEKYADLIIERVNSELEDLNSKVRKMQGDEEFREDVLWPRHEHPKFTHPRFIPAIARAYQYPDWFDSVDQEAILEAVKWTLDSYVREQAKTGPKGVWGPRVETSSNAAWWGHGELAQAYSLLHDPFEEAGLLSETLPDHPEGDVTRREAYTDFFDEALAWRSQVRNTGFYNQCALVTNGMVRMSRALELLNPERAPDRETVEHWIDELIGLAPMSPYEERTFHGDDSVLRRIQGKSYSEESIPELWRVHSAKRRLGAGNYYMVTEAGTLRERGRYATLYGSVGLKETAIMAYETGLQRVKDRVVDMVRARDAMTWWVKDAETGRRWPALDGTFSSRDTAHPGGLSAGYVRKHALMIWLSAPHEVTRRWAELLLEHGVTPRPVGRWGIRTLEALRAFQQLEKPSEYVVPMDRERYVWSDKDLGYVTVIDGETHMKMQAGLGKGRGVTAAARVHYHGPAGDRVLTIDLDRMDFPFAGEVSSVSGDLSLGTVEVPWREEPIELKSARAGKELKQAAEANGKRSSNEVREALGLHYRQLRVGPYLIGMNSTGAEARGFGPGKEYEMEVPVPAVDVRTGEKVAAGTVNVPPRTTTVLKLQSKNEN